MQWNMLITYLYIHSYTYAFYYYDYVDLLVIVQYLWKISLKWRHNERDGVSNHQPHDCLLSRLFRRRSKETSKLLVTGLCEGNSLVKFLAQRVSNAENVSIWWRHHDRGITERLLVDMFLDCLLCNILGCFFSVHPFELRWSIRKYLYFLFLSSNRKYQPFPCLFALVLCVLWCVQLVE